MDKLQSTNYRLERTPQQLKLVLFPPGFRGGAGWRLAMGCSLTLASLFLGGIWLVNQEAEGDFSLTGFLFVIVLVIGVWSTYLAYTQAHTQIEILITASRYRISQTWQRTQTHEGELKRLRYLGLAPPGLSRDLPRIQGIIFFESLKQYTEWGQALPLELKYELVKILLEFILQQLPADQRHLLEKASQTP